MGVFCEEHVYGFSSCFRGSLLFRARGKTEEVEVWENPVFGRIMVIDGQVQLSEKDELLYHEFLVHPPMVLSRSVDRVLIVGGGDGGAAREALRYGSEVTVVDIEPLVPKVSRMFFPNLSRGLEDTNLVIMDAFEFLKEGEEFDVVIADTTDPVGPAERLSTKDFFSMVKEKLGKGGVYAGQLGSPILDAKRVRETITLLEGVFEHVLVYPVPVPVYPSGTWSMFVAMDEPPRVRRAPPHARVLPSSILDYLELGNKLVRRLLSVFSAP